MNLKLTAEAAQALVNLRASPDFAAVLKWIADYREQFRDECCTAPPDKILRHQGRAEVVDGILKATVEAPRVLHNFKS